MRLILATAILALAAPAAARPRDAAALEAAQREAMAKLPGMDPIWRRTAWTRTPAGRHDVVHSERIGPFLDGTVKLIEGRACNKDGSVGFNTLGIVSYVGDSRWPAGDPVPMK